MVQFDNTYARLPERLFTRIAPEPAPTPEIALWNDALAELLGAQEWTADHVAGNVIPDGADPIAQAYSGHQFGNWNPQLGDGRAILLGEAITDHGRFDIQLKGAGRTPYSRNGDGRAWIGPVLREFLISEYMHAVGVPTTRALAATRTGAKVQREKAYPGAIVTRVARSHIRVGTFQYVSSRGDQEALDALTGHVRARHFPEAETVLDLYRAIVKAQADLIAKWMGLGFVHGVMNTDNMAVSGETIDYGPCAFMDGYASNTVFSSIDQFGRYAYDQQPSIAHWNLAQLGSCFVPRMEAELGGETEAIEALTEVLNSFPELYQTRWRAEFGAKLGIADLQEEDVPIVQDLLKLMAEGGTDFTNMFKSLEREEGRDHILNREAFDLWDTRWKTRRSDNWRAIMAETNPEIIPRTHRIEEAIQSALAGDHSVAKRLYAAFKSPFELRAEDLDLTKAPTKDQVVPQTFCGT